MADFHTLVNLVAALLFLPALPAYARLMVRLLPARLEPADPGQPRYLDQAALETPAIALACAAREALRLADLLEAMLAEGQKLVGSAQRRDGTPRGQDDVLDRLNTAIKAYLAEIDHDSLSDADQQRLVDVLGFAANLEAAASLIERGLLARTAKLARRGVRLAPETRRVLGAVLDRLSANLGLAAALFIKEDDEGATRLAAKKEEIPRDRGCCHGRPFRTVARRPKRRAGSGRDRRASRHPAGPQASQRPHRCGRSLPRAGAERPAAAEPDARRVLNGSSIHGVELGQAVFFAVAERSI